MMPVMSARGMWWSGLLLAHPLAPRGERVGQRRLDGDLRAPARVRRAGAPGNHRDRVARPRAAAPRRSGRSRASARRPPSPSISSRTAMEAPRAGEVDGVGVAALQEEPLGAHHVAHVHEVAAWCPGSPRAPPPPAAVALGACDLPRHVGEHEARVLAGADLVEGAHPDRRQAVGGAVLGRRQVGGGLRGAVGRDRVERRLGLDRQGLEGDRARRSRRWSPSAAATSEPPQAEGLEQGERAARLTSQVASRLGERAPDRRAPRQVDEAVRAPPREQRRRRSRRRRARPGGPNARRDGVLPARAHQGVDLVPEAEAVEDR